MHIGVCKTRERECSAHGLTLRPPTHYSLGIVSTRSRLLSRFLILFLFFASTASAWDWDNCGRDFSFDVVGAVSDYGLGGGDVQDIDACGHCSHAGAHLLGLASGASTAYCADSIKVGRVVNLSSTPPPSALFHPPRHTSSIA